jgi:hypothetical protein
MGAGPIISAFCFPDFSFCPCFPPTGFSFQRFASWPVEQCALGVFLAGRDSDQAPEQIGANRLSFPHRKVEFDNYRMFAIE